MLISTAIVFTLIGALLIYSTNKNQRLLELPINSKVRYIGLSFFIFSYIAWFQVLNPSSAFFIWLMMSALTFISIPLLTLTKAKK